jgi:hypothetical protein
MRQIRLSPQGLWHRPLYGNGDDHTACGEQYGNAIATREHILDLDLCPICFTRGERGTGRIKKLLRELQDDDEHGGLYFDEDYEKTDVTVIDIDEIPNDHDRKDENE